MQAETTETTEPTETTADTVSASTPATVEHVEASTDTDTTGTTEPAEPANPATLAEQLATARAELAAANAALQAALDRSDALKAERDQYAHDADGYQARLVEAIAARDKAVAEKAKLIGSVMATPTDARAEFASIGSAEKRLAYFAKHRGELAPATR